MKNFLRAARLALRHWPNLAAIFVCSLMVAVLWGANLGAVYPFVDVVFRGESMPKRVRREIAEIDAKSAAMRAEIARLRMQLPAARSNNKKVDLQRQIAAAKSRLEAETRAKAWATRLRPFADRYLPDTAFKTLILIVVWLLIGTILKCLFLVANSMLSTRLSEQLTLELRRKFFRSTLRFDLHAFQQQRSGALVSGITNEISKVVKGITTLVGNTLSEPLKMCACVIGAAIISWRLLFLTLIIIPPAIFLMTRLVRLIKRAQAQMLQERAALYVRLWESFTGFATVKAFSREGHERSRFHQACLDLYRRSIHLSRLSALLSPHNEILGLSIVGLTLIVGGHLVLHQETHLLGIQITERPLSMGGLLAFYAFIVGVADPLRKMSHVTSDLQGSFVSADRIYETLDYQPRIADPAEPCDLPPGPLDIVFEHVNFHYQEGLPVLRDLCLRVPFGESLAIVGPNGCGKSTLANLLLRFYDPTCGSITLGGVDLRELRQRDLRRHSGLVTQNTWLFDDSVRRNIRYGSLRATDEQVVEAAKKAHSHRFILEDLPRGYDSRVGQSGNQLSGGQRQRIALARAILRDPQILILDEATSQIDPESETLIHQALQQFIRGRTAIIITHRASTLALADRIAVMDGGRIVDIGTYQELLARCPSFRRFLEHSQTLRASA